MLIFAYCGRLINNFRIEGDNSPNSGIRFVNPMPKLIVQNLHISKFGLYGMYLLNAWDYEISDINVSSNKIGFYADQFNSSTLNKIVAFQNKEVGIIIESSANARITGTIQENGFYGLGLLGCMGCFISVYGEQNGFLGTTNEQSCEILVTSGGKQKEVSANNYIQYYLNGGDGSDMSSKYGVYLNWGSRNTLSGFSKHHNVMDIYQTTNSLDNILIDTTSNSKMHLTKQNKQL